MPASMIIALAGFMRNVSGSSIAIVAGGPRPGITPTTVPSTTPSEAPQQVERLQRDRESLQQPGEDVHAREA